MKNDRHVRPDGGTDKALSDARKRKLRRPDIYHRAFKALRAESTTGARSRHDPAGKDPLAPTREVIRKTGTDADRLSSLQYRCLIDIEWIERIEDALPHLDAAIREDRQFIRQDGEIVPIEKARHISRASVEHLSKHSNLITHLPEEGERLTPDKLLVVENLSNYAIYENRFIYMCLCYIRDFVTLRHEAIEGIWNSYETDFSMKKEIHLPHRHMSCTIDFHESSDNDTSTAYDPEVLSLMERMRAILHMVTILLATPLMKQVSEAPMLKPPITRTNLLRMNIHFKAAMEVYDFLSCYEGQGYEVQEIRTDATPYTEEIGDELSELVMLTSYMVFMYGKNMKDALDTVYEAEEARRRQADLEEMRRELDELRRRIDDSGQSPEQYMLLLEKRNAILEAESRELAELRPLYRQLEAEHLALQEAVAPLQARIRELERTVNSMTDMQKATEESHAAERAALQAACEAARQAAPPRSEVDAAVPEPGADARPPVEEAFVPDPTPAPDDFRSRYYLIKARYDGLCQKCGYLFDPEDLSIREAMEELESEYKAFRTLFNTEWKKAKRQIRTEYLWTTLLKRQKGAAAPQAVAGELPSSDPDAVAGESRSDASAATPAAIPTELSTEETPPTDMV